MTKTPTSATEGKVFKTVQAALTKRCHDCKTCKPTTEFSKASRNKNGLQGRCKHCMKQYKRNHTNSEHGFLSKLFDGARCHNRIRNARGRNLEFTLTLKHIKAKWVEQNGKCAITRMPMTLRPHSDFKCSIERISNDIGYTDGNCILVISEINTRSQWTAQKALHLFGDTVYSPINIEDELKSQEKIKQKYSNVKQWIINDDGNVFCHRCNETKHRSQFNQRLNKGCKTCVKRIDMDYRNSWLGALVNLYGSAKESAKRRRMDFPLRFEQLKQILISQTGLCYYSGVPMSPTLGEFRMSLERLNVLDTYTVTNSVLIVQEFQSGDFSRTKTEDSNDGSAGWSKDKFATVKAIYNA